MQLSYSLVKSLTKLTSIAKLQKYGHQNSLTQQQNMAFKLVFRKDHKLLNDVNKRILMGYFVGFH